MIVDYVDDFKKPFMDIHNAASDEAKKPLREKLLKEQLPAFLGNFEKFLKENKGGDGFLLGNGVTWFDCYFAHFVSELTSFVTAMTGGQVEMDTYPKLKAYLARVMALPAIAAWIKKRPVTDH